MTASLVRSDTFIRATRDSGYRSTAYALAELIDNSIQASASCINVLVDKTECAPGAGLTIAIVDDGLGMGLSEIAQALQFGGSSRFNSRSGQGRFGMGLPNASLSQARHVDVYSWTDQDCALHTSLDSDLISAGDLLGPSPIAAVKLPSSLRDMGLGRGTAVVWSKCDRIPYQRPTMLAKNLRRELGRIYRVYLDGEIAIRINGEPVRPIDPVRIRPRPIEMGEVAILPPLDFSFSTRGGERSDVRVTFAMLPVDEWAFLSNDEKRRCGITGSATVSVTRAGREIALGWYLMGSKKRENYDDWWRCEISFTPALDELFGVSHSKQGIRPVAELTEALAPTLESQARTLNRTIRERFAALKARVTSPAAIAQGNHHKLGSRDGYDRFRAQSLHQIVSPSYELDIRPTEDASFLTASRRKGAIVLTLNSNHPFYHRLYAPLSRGSSRSVKEAFDLTLFALARTLLSLSPEEQAVRDRLIENWSDAAALLLEER